MKAVSAIASSFMMYVFEIPPASEMTSKRNLTLQSNALYKTKQYGCLKKLLKVAQRHPSFFG